MFQSATFGIRYINLCYSCVNTELVERRRIFKFALKQDSQAFEELSSVVTVHLVDTGLLQIPFFPQRFSCVNKG